MAQTHNPPRSRKCFVKAANPEDAVHLFEQAAAGLDPDVGDAERTLGASRLSGLMPKNQTIGDFLARPRSERGPTLDEYVEETAVPVGSVVR